MSEFDGLRELSGMFIQVEIKDCEERSHVVIEEATEIFFHHVESEGMSFRKLTLDEDTFDQELFEDNSRSVVNQILFYMLLDLLLCKHFIHVFGTFLFQRLIQRDQLLHKFGWVLDNSLSVAGSYYFEKDRDQDKNEITSGEFSAVELSLH